MNAGILLPRSNAHPEAGLDFMDGLRAFLKQKELKNQVQFFSEHAGYGAVETEVYEKVEKLLIIDDVDILLAYIDENGNLSSKPPDPRKRITINAEDIELGVPKQEPLNPEDLIRTGIVTFFNNDKGYGFIKDMETQESVFVHINSLTEEIKENNKVTFEVEMGPKGANAMNVKMVK